MHRELSAPPSRRLILSKPVLYFNFTWFLAFIALK